MNWILAKIGTLKAKAKKVLKWEPKTTFKKLVSIMIASDYEKLKITS